MIMIMNEGRGRLEGRAVRQRGDGGHAGEAHAGPREQRGAAPGAPQLPRGRGRAGG